MVVVGSPKINLGGTFDSRFLKKATTELNKFVKDIQNKAKDINTHVLKMTSGYEKMGDVWVKSSSNIKKSIEQIQQPAKKTDALWGSMARSTTLATQAQRTFEKSLKRTSNALWLMTTGLQQFGTAMSTSFTIPLVAAAGLSLKVFTDWEKGTSAIQRTAEITSESARSITNSLIEISQQVPLTVNELQQAAVAAGNAGVQGEKAITKFAETAVKLSKVGGDALKDLPLDKLSNDLAKISIAFGVAGENFEYVTNVASMLLRVGKDIPGGLGEIIEGMRRVSAAANNAGVSIEQTTAMIGTLVAAAVPAARAGSQLTAAFRDLGKDTNWEYIAVKLGYTTDEVDKLINRLDEDFGGVLIELLEKISGIGSNMERIAVISEIFGKTGMKAIEPLVNNVEILNMLLKLSELEFERNTLLANDFAIQSGNLAGTFVVFANNAKALGKIFAEDLAPYVSAFLEIALVGIKKLIFLWQNLNGGVKLLIVGFAGLLAIIGPLALALNYLFLKPISGMITFYNFARSLISALTMMRSAIAVNAVSLNYYNLATIAATTGNIQLATSYVTAAKGASTLTLALAPLLAALKTITIVAGIAIAALWLLKKAGVNVRMPGIKYKKPEVPSMDLDLGMKDMDKATKLSEERSEIGRKAKEKELKAEEKALKKDLKAKQRQKKKELRALDKDIREYEKIRKAGIKAQEKLVDEQKDALDLRREQWEDERRLEEEKIRAQEETLETIRKTIKESKKALSELKKARDADLDVAEGMVDYNKMQLEAAQDRLRRMKILGKDEFDAEFRAAEAKVEAFEDSALLAKQNVIKIERIYQKQIDAQQDIVDINEEQADLENEALDDLRDALRERKAIVDKEVDLLSDELKIRRDILEDIKESTQEKLDLLREEQSEKRQAYDDEIELIQDRLDIIREQNEAIADATGESLGEISAGLAEFKKSLQDSINKMQEEMDVAMEGGGLEFDPGGIEVGGKKLPFFETLKNTFTEQWDELKRKSKEEGKSMIRVFFEGWIEGISEFLKDYYYEPLYNAIFGKGEWDKIHEKSKQEGKSVLRLMWEGMIKGIKENLTQLADKILWAIFGDKWISLKSDAEEEGVSITDYIIKGIIKGILSIPSRIGRFLETNIKQPIQDLANNAYDWGANLIKEFIRGIKSNYWNFRKAVLDALPYSVKRVFGIESAPEEGPLKNLESWMPNMMKIFADGIKSNAKLINNAISNTADDISGSIGTNLTGQASMPISKGKSGELATAPAGTVVNKNYYIQPGQMIASRGEIRNFVRMLKEYDRFEEGR